VYDVDMEVVPLGERAIDRSEEQPDVVLLRDCECLANRWGGQDFAQGLTDGVEISRTIRELGGESNTTITFTANHVRPELEELEEGEHVDIEDFFTRYVLTVDVSREIAALPPHIYTAAVKLYGEETVDSPDLYTESHRIFCTMSSEDGYFHHNLDVGYSIDDHDISYSGLDDCEGVSDYEGDDDKDEYEDVIDEFLDDGAATPDAECLPLPVEGEFWDDDADLSNEARLLNDAWELIREGSKNLNYDNTPFDIEFLQRMDRIDTKLEKREVRMERLWTIATMEIRNQQMQNCSNMLKLFSPKSPL
jgi:hypothetical protein